MLVYTPKGNVPVVGNYLKQCNLFLGEPSLSYGMQRLANYHYFNPHTPSGGRDDIIMAFNSLTSPERDHSRWTTPIINGKNIDVQRSQVDELFKSLKDEDGLVETEPCTLRGSYRCPTDTYVLAVGGVFSIDLLLLKKAPRWQHSYILIKRKLSLSYWNASGKRSAQEVASLLYGSTVIILYLDKPLGSTS